jgi:hypothetical protein
MTWTCTECGKTEKWGKTWRHLIEAGSVWCSPECENKAHERWATGDFGQPIRMEYKP